jgi:hypothetical protein
VTATPAAAAATGESLDELRWTWKAPLELTQASAYPLERWVLEQGRRPVVVVDRTTAGWSLSTAAERWTAAVRRRRGRLGWHLALTAAGEADPVLLYRPHTLLLGGALGGADDRRYKLRGPLLRADWTLAAARGEQLARVLLWTKPPSYSERARALRAGLAPAASQEPDLLLLLAAASVAILTHHQQPNCAGCCV